MNTIRFELSTFEIWEYCLIDRIIIDELDWCKKAFNIYI